jgi:hypothetical protein
MRAGPVYTQRRKDGQAMSNEELTTEARSRTAAAGAEEDLCDKKQACRLLGGIDIATLDRWISSRRIGHYKLGRRVFLSRSKHIQEFLSRCERKAI